MSTPLAEITYRYQGTEGKVYTKLEFYNMTGSIKDRIAAYIMEKALERGEYVKGQPIVETTSGNTGIAFAAIGAKLGSPVHIFMPEWASEERKLIMNLYGANLHLVTAEEGGFEGALELAEKLAKEIGAYMPHQFDNPDNVMAHFTGTGEELIKELPDVTDFISGIGTGGTLMGVGKRLKQDAGASIVAIEPDKAPFLGGGEIKNGGIHLIEGIGDGFIPSIVDKSAIDVRYEINDVDAFLMAKKISTELGISAGISCGANFLGCVKRNAERGGAGKPATVFADDNKKYLSVFAAKDFAPEEGEMSKDIELVSYRLI